MERKKVIIGYDFLSEIGGLERVMFFIANVLSEKYDVELVFSYVDEKKKNEIVKLLELNSGIKITSLNNDKNESIALIKSFINPSKINKFYCDLIISNSFLFSVMSREYCKKNKCSYIVLMHHPPNFLYSPVSFKKWVNNPARFFAFLLGVFLREPLKRVDKNVVKKSRKVLVSSNYTIGRVQKIYGIKPSLLYPNVSSFFKKIDQKKSRKILERFNLNYPYVLLHGRVIPDKRPDLFLDLARIMRNYKINDKRLNFIISGDIDNRMRKILDEKIVLRKLENVKILGKVSREELRALYNMAEVFCVMSPKEDFGLTPVEAMACGTPVIAWDDKAGPNETVKENISGLFVKPYDILDYREKLIEALKKKWDRKKIIQSVKKFSEEKIGKEIMEIVESVLN